jgi:predicted small secreted protein
VNARERPFLYGGRTSSIAKKPSVDADAKRAILVLSVIPTHETMKTHYLKFAWVVLGAITMIGASSCRNTAQGVVRDTERNTQKVGQGMEHVGEKIQDTAR